MNGYFMDRKLSTSSCLQDARMLVPKFGYKYEGAWHIHWPKDHPHVLHAETEKGLVIKLAKWMQELGRVGNQYKHVTPEYPNPPFGTQIHKGGRDYLEHLAIVECKKRIKECEQKNMAIECQAAKERDLRRQMAAAGDKFRKSAVRSQRIEGLSGLTIDEQLEMIVNDTEFPPQFYPTNIAMSSSQEIIENLPYGLRIELARRLKGKRRGPWGGFKKRLLFSLGKDLWDKKPWSI
ncbi:MAG: hypothetical protein P1U35_13815 [Cycloclasticus sp.]|nr:hypothetical protein [Cycloclasticus sp.]